MITYITYRMVLKKEDTVDFRTSKSYSEIRSKGGWADESPGSWAVGS